MAQLQRKKLARTSYHVAWICPVADLELLPAVLMLDEEHDCPDIDNHTDENVYEFGSAAGHNIVLATCRQGMTGNVNVSSITSPLFKTFPNIRMTLLVGIGGGVPQPDTFSDPLNDLRLGDVVVGWPTRADGRGAVVYYESGRSKVDGFEMTGTMDKPHTVLLNALPSLKLHQDLGRSTFHQHMAKLQNHERLGNRFAHPGLKHDRLFKSHYRHVGGYKSDCKDCDSLELVDREPRKDSQREIFVYHQGRIATGNSVIMDGEKRDAISAQCGETLCVEMEAAGVEVNSRCLVIRGISDYADSHKSDRWRSYAAGKAVVFARELLGKIPARDVKEKMASGQLALYYPEPIVVGMGEMIRQDDQPCQALLIEDAASVQMPWGQRDELYHVPGNKHWLVDRSTNPHFTGRRKVIDRIAKRLTSDGGENEQRRFVLTGAGGQGKSEICLQVANEIRERFWGIFWVDVSTRNAAEENFAEVAEALGCSKSVDAVRKTLATLIPTSRWLLILDNADDPQRDYEMYIPSGTRGAVLITSRNPQCGHLTTAGDHEELDSLEEPECIQLLQKTARMQEVASGTEEHAFAISLVKDLGYHTLAILHAGSYIATAQCSMVEYLEFLRMNRRRLLQRSRGQGQSRYDTVYATFGASVEFLERPETGASEETRKDALQLLKVLSTFHYMRVPLDIFLDARRGLKYAIRTGKQWSMYSDYLTACHVAQVPDIVRTEKADIKLRITDAVARLESLSLVRIEQSGRAWKCVSMHPLVHGWAGDRQSQQERKKVLRMTECVVAIAYYAFERWRPYYPPFTVHLKRLVESDVELMEDAAQSRHVLQACVQIAWMYHRMDQRDMYEFTGRIFQRLGLLDQEPTVELREVYWVFAQAANFEGSQPTQAVRVFEAIVRLDEKTLGENDPKRLRHLRSLGGAYRNNAQATKAIAILKKVVKAEEELGHEERILLARHDLALALGDDGQIKEAIALLANVVRIRQRSERSVPEDNPDLLVSRQMLAVAYFEDGQIAEATRGLEEVYWVKLQTYGEEHLSTTETQYYLAGAYQKADRLSEAIALYERVINSQTLILDETHPTLLRSQEKLAAVYLNAGMTQEAINILERLVANVNSTLNDTDRGRLKSQHELGRAYLEDGRISEAIKTLGVISQHALGRAYLDGQRVSEAIDILERVVTIRNSTLDETDKARLVSQHELGRAYLEDGRVSEAIEILERVVDIKNSVLEEKDPERLVSQHVLSKAYLASGRIAEAIGILEHVVQVNRLLYAEGHQTRVLSQELLGQAYAMHDRFLSTSITLFVSKYIYPGLFSR